MALAIDEHEAACEKLDEEADGNRRIGQLIGESYRITHYIGSGGSSQVFEAEHLRLGKRFAVKLLRADVNGGRKTARRFRREAKAIALVNNQHVVSVVDCGELQDQTPYLVMELLEGEDLRNLLQREGTLSVRRACQLILEACRGLTSVHAAGLIHRDLKPENLFIAQQAGGDDRCKILDFGVAKMQSTLSTAQGAIVGTVRYMAPEQLESGPVGPPTDVYALGAILYECLSGQPLHAGETVQEVMYRVMSQAPAPLATLCPSLPRPLVDVVHASVSKAIEARPQTAADLARRMQAAVWDGQVSPGDATVSEDSEMALSPAPPADTVARLRWLVPALLGCVAGLVVAWLSGMRGDDQPAPGTKRQLASAAMPVATPSASTVTPRASFEAPALASPVASTERAASTSALPKSQKTPSKARVLTAATAASVAAPRTIPVGNLDAANPYGE